MAAQTMVGRMLDRMLNRRAEGLAGTEPVDGAVRASVKEAPFGPVAMTVEMQRSLYSSPSKMLRPSSLAYRIDRQIQRKMRLDPDIMGPLYELQMCVVQAPWSIKRDDPMDESQKVAAKEMTRALRAVPSLPAMIRQLADCAWFGCSAVNLIYRVGGPWGMEVADWLPMHPDSLAFKETGELCIKVGPRYYQGAGTLSDKGKRATEVGWESRVHELEAREREAVVFTRFFAEAPDFDDANESAIPYMGLGLRDVCWHSWLVKQTILQNWAAYCERYGMGIRKGFYQEGNPTQKAEMNRILQNLVGDVAAVMPMRADGQAVMDIEVMDPSGTNAEAFARLVEWFASNLKELIIGQSATSESVSTGLGSNVADKHDQTKGDRVGFLASTVAEALTRELVHVLWRSRHGDTPCPLRLEFQTGSVDPKSFMEACGIAVELGLDVPQRDVLEKLGIREPEDGEPVLEQQMDEFGSPHDLLTAAKDKRAIGGD